MATIELNQTADEYHASTDIISNSGKECFRKSQALYYGQYVAKTIPWPEPTPALKMGTWVHTAILEPDVWASKYVCELMGIDRRTTIGKTAHADFCLRNEGREIVPAEDWWMVIGIREAVLANDAARKFLDAPGEVEHSFKWTDDETGLELKSRPDKTLTSNIILDLKTTDDASPESFFRSCLNFGYHRTAAWRGAGHLVRTGEQASHLFIAVSKKTFEVGLYQIEGEVLRLGQEENRRLIDRMAVCYERDEWAAEWTKQVLTVTYPGWAFRSAEWESE